MPLGVQLTAIDSELDLFWKFRDVLLANDRYRVEYDELKKQHEGKTWKNIDKRNNGFLGA
ncbi:hypothetical protein M493_09057 [Geobacillus genomosp. 3]|uniref:Uncharacterized protein n=1 Tax=Geobacillus genomosp. 3 TaxID=1921421 RepID=V5LVR6_GEOG3|nr:hypothetical protein [Geobacillus genomosp. 3]AHA58141.1 hypothetical protein M493_09057 [Geobacillus genomosp. 3]